MQRTLLVLAIAIGWGLVSGAALAAEGDVSGPKHPDFKIQGEYSGEIESPDGSGPIKLGAQVIALGEGKFRGVAYVGGLPGDGWDGFTKFETEGEVADGKVTFEGDEATAKLEDGAMVLLGTGGEELGKLKKVMRKSPTLGKQPPEGAVVLFDGTSAEEFQPGRMSDDGLLIAGAASKQKFGDCELHVEFLLPFMPEARGQGRGNSGCYLQGRYEVQMLDSFGLEGEDNECGGIYGIRRPDVNMCFPPLSWQTYDIDFKAAEYQDGKKVKNATMTVRHNGEVIHRDVEVPEATRAAPVAEGDSPGPIYLQDHGNPVRYRNIWVVEK
ncbi:MAG: DUF1080 domain-containing protein [Planctomycetota bacterium]|nr:MAG: DUF1080 domain-containing protein [Planctomycetota bacterium]